MNRLSYTGWKRCTDWCRGMSLFSFQRMQIVLAVLLPLSEAVWLLHQNQTSFSSSRQLIDASEPVSCALPAKQYSSDAGRNPTDDRPLEPSMLGIVALSFCGSSDATLEKWLAQRICVVTSVDFFLRPLRAPPSLTPREMV